MKFGLSEDQYNFILKHVIAPLKKEGAEIYCYGSRARGDNHKFSDLDLMIHSDHNLERITSKISEFLSSSNFPYKVDLVDWSQFADSYKAGYLQDRIQFE